MHHTVRRLYRRGCLIGGRKGKAFMGRTGITHGVGCLLKFSGSYRTGNVIPSEGIVGQRVMRLSSRSTGAVKLRTNDRTISVREVGLTSNIPVVCRAGLFPCRGFTFLLRRPLSKSLFRLLRGGYRAVISCSGGSCLSLTHTSKHVTGRLEIPGHRPLFFLCSRNCSDGGRLICVKGSCMLTSRCHFCLSSPGWCCEGCDLVGLWGKYLGLRVWFRASFLLLVVLSRFLSTVEFLLRTFCSLLP